MYTAGFVGEGVLPSRTGCAPMYRAVHGGGEVPLRIIARRLHDK